MTDNNTNIGFLDFCKNYIRINDSGNIISFNNYHLKRIEEMQHIIVSGYEFRIIKHRRSSNIMITLGKKQ